MEYTKKIGVENNVEVVAPRTEPLDHRIITRWDSYMYSCCAILKLKNSSVYNI